MNESIYTIPINEVFEKKCGCPICEIKSILEERSVTYIMGAAMMEPDVRIETNRLGFCDKHYEQMLNQRNRLSLALMLESHLAEIKKGILNGKVDIFKKTAKAKKVEKLNNTCFVCEHIEKAISGILNNMIDLYCDQEDFRHLFAEQEAFCLPHYQQLCELADSRMPKDYKNKFIKQLTEIVTNYVNTLSEDVSHFCRMFDYRNSGPNADWGNSKDSVERAVWFLTSYKDE